MNWRLALLVPVVGFIAWVPGRFDRAAAKRFRSVKMNGVEVTDPDSLTSFRRSFLRRALLEEHAIKDPRLYQKAEEDARTRQPMVAVLRQTQVYADGRTEERVERALVVDSRGCRVTAEFEVAVAELGSKACVHTLEDPGGWMSRYPVRVRYEELDLANAPPEVQTAWNRMVNDEMVRLVLWRSGYYEQWLGASL